ncbi:MAG: hypothetical protein KF819_34050 [Labilithrix sp.]|nr:hypothetical protein [Labilithrix sp.]
MSESRETAAVADAIEIDAWRDLYAAAPPSIRRAFALDVVTIGDACVFVAKTLPMAMFNRCIGLGNERSASESDLDAALGALEAANVWVTHGPASRTPEIAGWLEARRFRPAPRAWLKLLRDDSAPAHDSECPYVVREIGAEHGHAFARTLADAHGMPGDLVAWTEALIGRPGWRAYAAFEDDTVVAGGMVYVTGDRAWIGLGGTIAAHRERGAQAAILAQRIGAAIDAGCTVLATEAGERAPGERAPSYDNMIKAGFRVIATRKNFERA